MQISLDGQLYEIRGGIIQQPIIEWPDNIRLDGQQLRKDRRYLSSWAVDDVSGGLGKRVSDGAYLWDVENVDTRFAGQKILSPALVTCTIIPSANVRGFMEYQNDLYFFGGSLSPVPLYKFAGPQTLGSNTVIGSTNLIAGAGVQGVHVMGGDIVIAARNGIGPAYFISLGSIGAVGTIKAAFAGATIRDVKFADIGGTVHALAYDEGALGYGFYIIPRALGSLVPIASYAGVVGTQLAPLITDNVNVYANLPDGIYNFDAVPDKIIDTSRSLDKNPNQVMFQNMLYFKNKYSTMRYDGTDIVVIGYDKYDGLPSDKMGEITAFAASWRWTFAAVKGGTYTNILAYDGSAWQYYARWPTAGIWIKEMKLTDAPDGIDRLWCIPGNDVFPCYFLNPMVNPLGAPTYGFVGTGYFTPPIFGGGMPDVAAGFYKAVITSEGIGTAGIGTVGAPNRPDGWLQYGINGNLTSLYGRNWHGKVLNNDIWGYYFGSHHAEFYFGSLPGVEAQRIQIQVYLSRGTYPGTTPNIKEVLVQYLKDPSKRYIYDFNVDLEKTAREWQNPVEAVIGSLNHVTNLKTLAPFWYGQIATTYVKVLDQPADEQTKESQGIYNSERTGFVRLRVAEIL